MLRKGKGNYVCEKRLAHFISFADPRTKLILATLEKDGIVDLAEARHLTPYIKRAVCVNDACGRECPRYGCCRYTRFLQNAKCGGFDFQVCNHNFLLADLLRRSRGERPLIQDYQAVIIDEAHKFLDAARQMYGASLSLMELRQAAKDVHGFTFAHGVKTADVTREAERILSKSALMFQFLNKEVPAAQFEDDETERFATNIRQKTERIMLALHENTKTLYSMLSERQVAIKYEARKKQALRTLSRINNSLTMFSQHSGLVYWLEESETPAAGLPDRVRFPVLQGIPKNLGKLLNSDLWGRNIPIILTSGTLSAEGSFEHIKRKMGLDHLPEKRLRESCKPSPFNHRENALLYISEATPFPNNRDSDYIDAVTDEAERLIQAAHGHTVLLFTSYKAMDMVWERLGTRQLPYPVFRLDRGGASVIEQFKQSGNGILFASGAIWEGIDIPGDILSMLIIVRLPFAVPDPVGEWERTLYGSLDEYKAEVVVPEMLIKLKQGFGRLIRTEKDSGCVAILDCRVNMSGSYRNRVLSALPPCRVASDIEEVERFMRDRKPAAYFQ